MDELTWLLQQKKLKESGRLDIRIASDSMHPLLTVGQLVQMRPFDIGQIFKYQIIVFRQNQQLLAHFVWATQTIGQQTVVITKSLKNPRDTDLPIRLDDILGQVEIKFPSFYKLKMWLINR